jgi:cytochrome c oxidase subunit 3
MATAVAAHGTHQNDHEVEHHVRMNRLGLWLFFFSDALVFAMLLTARFYMAGTSTPHEVSQSLGLAITSVLLLSSLTAFRGETALAHGNVAHGRTMLLLTMLLGLGFGIGVGFEWSIAHWSVSDAYGTAFFSMTGMHAMHVFSGIVILFFAWLKAGKGYYNKGGIHAYGVSAAVMYWHFVDIVWVFFYPALYLLK